MTNELTIKHERLLDLMDTHQVDAVWLTHSANVAWASGGGRPYIDTSTEQGVATLLVTREQRYVLTNNIEAERLRHEEGFGNWEIVAEPWYDPSQQPQQLAQGLRLAADHASADSVDVSQALVQLRAPLTSQEIERYRALGHDAGTALGEVARAITPGMTEHDVAAQIAAASYRIGAVPVVVLVSSDERMDTVRHPLPTAKRVERRAMLVLCARRHGLIANLTRLVYFGVVPDDLEQRMAAVAQIDTDAIAMTKPGTRLNTIFERIQQSYQQAGYAGEWRQHHQGGPCSYGGRDMIVTPHTEEQVHAPQAFAWNPSVPGAKSEDTVLITGTGPEVLTPSPDWPVASFSSNGLTIERPLILAR